jgi:hypothetical protein
MAVSDYTADINASSAKWGVDPLLVAAVMAAESGGNQTTNGTITTSSTGALGLMQLEPATAAALGVDPTNAAQNIDGGAHYLAELLAQFGGDTSLAIAAYNAGPGAVEKAGGIPANGETPAYVQTVLGTYQAAGGGTVSGAVAPFVAGDTTGSGATTVYGQTLGTSSTPAQQAAALATTPAPAAAAGTPGVFGPVIDAANNIATEVFLGAIALALLSGGILWLASTDPSIRSAATTAAKAA